MHDIVCQTRRYARSEDGAAAIDWVVMTAATVALGLAVMGQVSSGVEAAATRLAARLADMPIRTSFEQWDAFRAEQAPEGDEPQAGASDDDG